MANSTALGTDLKGLSLVVLSHGHYDHTGGLPFAVQLNPGLRVVAHPRALHPHLAMSKDGASMRDVGIPHSEEALEKAGVSYEFVTEFKEVLSGVWFTGQVPRTPRQPLGRSACHGFRKRIHARSNRGRRVYAPTHVKRTGPDVWGVPTRGCVTYSSM